MSILYLTKIGNNLFRNYKMLVINSTHVAKHVAKNRSLRLLIHQFPLL